MSKACEAHLIGASIAFFLCFFVCTRAVGRVGRCAGRLALPLCSRVWQCRVLRLGYDRRHWVLGGYSQPNGLTSSHYSSFAIHGWKGPPGCGVWLDFDGPEVSVCLPPSQQSPAQLSPLTRQLNLSTASRSRKTYQCNTSDNNHYYYVRRKKSLRMY